MCVCAFMHYLQYVPIVIAVKLHGAWFFNVSKHECVSENVFVCAEYIENADGSILG